MFKNHVKIAWRSLKRQPFFTFLNTIGLAIGMAGGLLISLYIYDEVNFDTMFKDAERIYRIDADIKFGGTESKSAEVSAPMAAAMERDFSQVELTTRFRDLGSMLLRKSNAEANVKEQGSTFVDATFFEMFGLDLLEGDVRTALKEPNTLVLTRTAALKHFGLKDALGQKLLLNNTDTYTVTGVIEDMSKRSFLRNHNVFMSMAGSEEAKNQEWTSHNFFTFIKLNPESDIADFQEPLQSMLGTYIMPYVQTFLPGATEEQLVASGNYLNFSTTPLKDIHLYSDRDYELSQNSSIQNVYILSFIGLFLIILASVNFMNLSTAQSLKRAKEVGIRKTLGSDKSALIRQFLTESGLISFISLLFALGLAALATPYFNALSGKSISIPFTDPFFWTALLFGAAVLAFLSGMYPAFFMSRFVPVKVLKGAGSTSTGGGNIRSFLVVFQFAISVFLIVSTLVVFMQLKFIQSKDLGFTKDQVLIVEDVYTLGEKTTAFKEEVAKLGQVENATLSSFLPTPSSRSNTSFFKEGGATAENSINMQIWNIDHNYIPTLNMEIIEGRNFDSQFATDSTAMLINESAAAILGVQPEEALGMRIIRNFENGTSNYFTIIGVVKNFNYESLRENIGALSMTLGRSTGALAVKLEAGDFMNAITSIEGIWSKVAPGQPFSYRFMEDSFNTTYKAEQQLGSIFMTFTLLSILIACLGLFGLAAFNAQKRTKEIGIRKVLGASVGQITYRLTTDFLKMVGIAIAVALPIGWYLMNRWLEDFTYRMEISWWVLATAALIALTIAILTVSYQSIKAAIVNPVKSLRTE
ncbi:FtsX-like permease family protein [Arenibacter aquaticus]|uniref:FtsX-like permease family protein n=1 Tax=Arenibacter aquaticus TaxID=2489054 RepID=A0A430K5J9_9FLAO|nr:ABC transporter permease [Arenibacter aquaticus]RTE54332.1 FtsX-like permease family protein [Arenibacter aquaticus]